jgi:hypothetical protein
MRFAVFLLRGYAIATPGYRRGIPSGGYMQVQFQGMTSIVFSREYMQVLLLFEIFFAF